MSPSCSGQFGHLAFSTAKNQNNGRFLTRILSRFIEWVKRSHFFMRHLNSDRSEDRSSGRVRLVLLFTVPLFAFFFALYVSTSRSVPLDTHPLETLLLGLHIAGATMGQLLAFLSSGIALAFLWQNKCLKQKRWQPIMLCLPALD